MIYGAKLPGGQTLAQWYDDLQYEENDAAAKEGRQSIILNPEYQEAKGTELFPFLKRYLNAFYDLSWYRPQSLSGIPPISYETINLYLDNMEIFRPVDRRDMILWIGIIDWIYISEWMLAEKQKNGDSTTNG